MWDVKSTLQSVGTPCSGGANVDPRVRFTCGGCIAKQNTAETRKSEQMVEGYGVDIIALQNVSEYHD